MLRTCFSLWIAVLLQAPARQEVEPSPPTAVVEGRLYGLPPELLARIEQDAPAHVELGARLFAEKALSRDGSIACASCHDPAHGFADPVPLSRGVGGARTLRNAPSLYNRATGKSFMWDGRAPTLEEQVLQPIQNELEMALPLADALARLRASPSYAADFRAGFGREVDTQSLAQALASFVRSITLAGSPYDHFLQGSFDALSPAERAGLWLFESRGGCWRCHRPPLFTDEGFHATGIGAGAGELEPGRMAITAAPEDRGGFKTPGLRGLERTAPYMHDGSLATLEDVVAYYRRGGNPASGLDPHVVPLAIDDTESAQLVAFLRCLSREAGR